MDNIRRIVYFTDLNVNNFGFSTLRDSPFIPTQQLSYINNKFNESKIIFQTPYIITETYGIPKEGPFYANERARAFYKLPFCHDRKKYLDHVKYDEIELLYNKMKEIDDYFMSDEFKEKMFGKNKNKYEYQPLVKSARINDDDEDSRILGFTPPYMKIKFDLDYNTKVPKLALFDKNVDGTVKNLIDLKHIDDIQNYIKYLTKVRFIIEFTRVYVIKNINANGKKNYGVMLKISTVECINNYMNNSTQDENTNKILDFID